MDQRIENLKKYGVIRDANIEFYNNANLEWAKTYLKAAETFAERSHCSAKKVCCIIVKNNNIISVGINGTISGTNNCDDKFEKINGLWYKASEKYVDDSLEEEELILCEDQEEHHNWSLKNEVHAEINALVKAAKHGISVSESLVFLTHSPCQHCALALYSAGIRTFFISNIYEEEPLKFLYNLGDTKIYII